MQYQRAGVNTKQKTVPEDQNLDNNSGTNSFLKIAQELTPDIVNCHSHSVQ